MKKRIFFLIAGSGGGTTQTTGEGQQTVSNQTTSTAGEGQQTTSTANQTNQTQNTQTEQINNSQQQTTSTTNQTQNTQTEQKITYVSLDEVKKMMDERDVQNFNKIKNDFEKKDLIGKISQDANLKSLLDKKFPKWDEKPLEEIKNIKTVYEGIVQSQLVSGASEKPGNTSTQNSDTFVSTGNATKDYENFCRFKREQKKKQQANPTQTNSTTATNK